MNRSRDPSHDDHVERWARFVRDNPMSVWNTEQKKIVDSRIIMTNSSTQGSNGSLAGRRR